MNVLNELFEIVKGNLFSIGIIAVPVILFVIALFEGYKPRKQKEKPIVNEEKKGTPGWVWIVVLLLAFIGWQLYVSNTKPTTQTVIVATPTPTREPSWRESTELSIEETLQSCLDRAGSETGRVNDCYEDYDYSLCVMKAAWRIDAFGGKYYEGQCDPGYGREIYDP